MKRADNDDAYTPLRFEYVLILEFLSEREPRTGSSLQRAWLQRGANPFEMVVKNCVRADDVLQAIRTATADVPCLGTPIIHIESHGCGDANALLGLGYEDGDRTEFLAMRDLWDVLRPLNLASDFNLMVVASSCFGEHIRTGVIDGISRCLPTSLMACVGFSGTVRSDRLLSSMIDMYSCLARKIPLESSVAHANKLLCQDELLTFQWTAHTVQAAINQVLSADSYYSYADRYRTDFPQASDSEVTEETRKIATWQPHAIEAMLSVLFSLDTHPSNRERFNLPTPHIQP